MSPLPIRELDRLPNKVTPRPVVEAVFDIRFITDLEPSILPGVFHSLFAERYGQPRPLPAHEIPESFRKEDPHFTYQPLHLSRGEHFNLQFGPRVITLTTTGSYPGWSKIEPELNWLIEKLSSTSAKLTPERLGVRYLNFFPGDVVSELEIGLHLQGLPMAGNEINFSTIFPREAFKGRLAVNNRVSVLHQGAPISGTLVDLDFWLGADQFSLFEDGIDRFTDAHRITKEIFFGILKPSFLDSLAPEYP